MPGVSLGITLPTVSTTVGPTWATNLNTAIQTIIDDVEALIVPSEININADLSFGNYELDDVGALELQNKTATITGAANACKIHVVSGDLYYTNSSGTAVQITNANALDVTSAGGFGTDYGDPNGQADYTDSSNTFRFTTSAGDRNATIDVGNVVIREEDAAAANAITVQSPSSLASAYSITLPTAVPGSTLPILMDSSGVLTVSGTLSNLVAITTSGAATIGGTATFSGNIASSGTTNQFNNGLKVSNTAGIDTTIDAYSDTTFTPTLWFDGVQHTTFSTQQGRYVRLGKWIIATVYLAATSVGSESGTAVTLRGFPGTVDFTSMTQWTGHVSHFTGGTPSWDGTDFVGCAYMDRTTDEVMMTTADDGVLSTWTFDTTCDIALTVAYRTS